MFHRITTAIAAPAGYCECELSPHSEAQTLTDSFLAKLALGETAAQSRKAIRHSYYQVHPPRSLGDHFRKFLIQLTTTSEVQKYTESWFIEVSALVEKIIILPETERQKTAQYITDRFHEGTADERRLLIYRHRARYGLEVFLRWYWAERGMEYRCGRYSQNSVWLKQFSRTLLTNGLVPSKYVSREQLGWQVFVKWCCERGFTGLLGRSYFVPEAKFKKDAADLIEEKTGEGQEAYTKTLKTLINCAGGIKAALAIAGCCKYFDETEFCLQPVTNIVGIIETLDELAIVEDAMEKFATSALDNWASVSLFRRLIATRALEIIDREVAEGKLDKWAKSQIQKNRFTFWVDSIREWIKDPTKKTINTADLDVLKEVPHVFKFLSTLWRFERVSIARGLPGGYFGDFLADSPLARIYYMVTKESKLIRTSGIRPRTAQT
jgi:hypothetical protein